MFELTRKVKTFFTIVMPFGNYKYLRLLIWLKCSPDIAEAAMENVLSDIEKADV